jgi:hypothetical protein
MFDVINGLPLHALVVHGVVVLLPLMAIVTAAVAFRPAWREGLAWWVVAADALVVVLTFVAIQSGKTFQKRLGGQIAISHGNAGRLMIWFALGLLVAALLVALLARSGGATATGLAVLTALVGLAAIGWTLKTGDSGAKAVWESVIQNTKAP